VRKGAACREIRRLAAEGHAELIVMGVHGRGAIDLRYAVFIDVLHAVGLNWSIRAC
jgi:nucleotide-binding universal stress UspA family protein